MNATQYKFMIYTERNYANCKKDVKINSERDKKKKKQTNPEKKEIIKKLKITA